MKNIPCIPAEKGKEQMTTLIFAYYQASTKDNVFDIQSFTTSKVT